MPLELFIERWVAIFSILCGLSHLLYPARWAELLWPLRERANGGFILAATNLPIGLAIVLGHNIWVWDIPVIVTVIGWLSTVKGTAYLLIPRAHTQVMRSSEHMTGQRIERGFIVMGALLIVLGAAIAYHAFFRVQ
jgi:hypothetical protein